MVVIRTDLSIKEGHESKKIAPQAKEKDVSIMGTEIVKDPCLHEDIGVDKGSETDTMADILGQIANTEGTLKDVGCYSLYGAASSAKNKAKAILNGVSNQLKAFDNEIKNLYADKNLTEDELNKKIELIEAKKNAVIAEGEAKMKAVSKISDMLLNLVGPFMKLQQMGINPDEYTRVISELLGTISSSPSSLTGAKTTDDLKKISQKNIKNIFGSGSVKKLDKFINDTDKKIDTAKDKLKQKETNPEEKQRLKTEIEVYKIQKNVFKDLFKQLEGIKFDED